MRRRLVHLLLGAGHLGGIFRVRFRRGIGVSIERRLARVLVAAEHVVHGAADPLSGVFGGVDKIAGLVKGSSGDRGLGSDSGDACQSGSLGAFVVERVSGMIRLLGPSKGSRSLSEPLPGWRGAGFGELRIQLVVLSGCRVGVSRGPCSASRQRALLRGGRPTRQAPLGNRQRGSGTLP